MFSINPTSKRFLFEKLSSAYFKQFEKSQVYFVYSAKIEGINDVSGKKIGQNYKTFFENISVALSCSDSDVKTM